MKEKFHSVSFPLCELKANDQHLSSICFGSSRLGQTIETNFISDC